LITYSETADALYIQLRDEEVVRVTPIDDLRIIDYAQDGSVVGVEFLAASEGLNLKGLPEGARLAELIRALQFSMAV
jgi:uncharacterized protein YuzE